MKYTLKSLYYNNTHAAGISSNTITRQDPGPCHPRPGLHHVPDQDGQTWRVLVKISNKKRIRKGGYWPEMGYSYTLLVMPIERVS